VRNALAVLETERIWDQLRARYYRDWKSADRDTWNVIHTKLAMVDELREELRKIANSGEIDNAGSTSAK
jgi:hypothetical protein